MQGDAHVSIVVCSAPTVCATALLNTNAFPKAAETEATFAARRLAVLLRNASDVSVQIEKDASSFFFHLKPNWHSYVADVRARSDLEFIAYADGLGYISSIHSVLYELKAFLDLYTRLVCKLIAPDRGAPGFNKGKCGGVEISGGRLVNWIAGCSLEAVPHQTELGERIAAASRDWITAAVDFRDALGHFRDLPGFRHMRVSVSRGPQTISLSDILRPEMPDGRTLDEYADTVARNLCSFVAATIPLVPQVNASLLEPWERASKYLHISET